MTTPDDEHDEAGGDAIRRLNDSRIENDAEDGAGGDDPASRRRIHTASFSGGRDSRPSRSVVEAVAEATGRDATALRPLYDVVDADALDALLDPAGYRSSDLRWGRVTFRYEGCDVAVHADGRTVVLPPETDERRG